MNRKLAIAGSIALALATTACSDMAWMRGGSSGGEASYMGGSAPVAQDPAGTATFGTGSTSVSGADRRVENAAGIGID